MGGYVSSIRLVNVRPNILQQNKESIISVNSSNPPCGGVLEILTYLSVSKIIVIPLKLNTRFAFRSQICQNESALSCWGKWTLLKTCRNTTGNSRYNARSITVEIEEGDPAAGLDISKS